MKRPQDIPGFWQDNPLTNGFRNGAAWLLSNPNTATAGSNSAVAQVSDLIEMPGENREHLYMGKYGSQEKIRRLTQSMLEFGFDPKCAIFVVVKRDGKPTIFEGNHRVRAAYRAGIREIPVEIRYQGGSENIEGVWVP